MAQISQIEYIPDLNPAKKDLLKIHLSFDKDDINKQFVIEINHVQGEGKSRTNIARHGLFLITAERSEQVYEHILKHKICCALALLGSFTVNDILFSNRSLVPLPDY